MNVNEEKTGEIVLYQPEGEVKLEVRVENETVWLTQAQMAEQFGVQRQAITKHIKNIFETQELEERGGPLSMRLTMEARGRPPPHFIPFSSQRGAP